ncbi:hypothetical protein C8N24_3132 [Solirubrobacter pauli]|uniref:DUF5666 domain-containing protein n=1 Tax=Solirubrobacter pauli TaxID=166793 RepID=A0A660LJK8_9ACTN|nr:DUF5666 domain-containing protein [Solirubrobacter pauli]RKQ93271.1 hypothetical protein C8N24_3132 [Solirubrobacter pauli]
MKKLLRTALIAVAALTIAAPAASAQTREYEGTIVSVDRDARTFRIKDSERGTVTVRVTSRTRFERISGFSDLRAGQKHIETTVRRSNGRWVATEVERSGGGGSHGNRSDDDSSDDRGRGRDDDSRHSGDDDGTADQGRGDR